MRLSWEEHRVSRVAAKETHGPRTACDTVEESSLQLQPWEGRQVRKPSWARRMRPQAEKLSSPSRVRKASRSALPSP